MTEAGAVGGADQAGGRASPTDRYLAVATALARGDSATVDGLPHLASQISINELADALGVTRTALYRRWPTRNDLWVDLMKYVAFQNDFSKTDDDMPWAPPPESLEPVDLASPELLEVIRRQFNTSLDLVLNDITWVVRSAQLAYPEEGELAHARSQVEQRRLTTLAARIAIGLQRGRRRFRPAYTLYDLTAALWSLGDGLIVRAHWLPEIRDDPVIVDDGNGPLPWTLTGYAFRCMLFEMTEPIDPPGSSPLITADLSALKDLDTAPPAWTPAQCETLTRATDMLFDRLGTEAPTGHYTVLPHITIDRVARATGVSRRAVYDVWPTRDAMLIDLLQSLLDAESADLAERIGRSRAAAGTHPDLAALGQAILTPRSENVPCLEQATIAYLSESRRPEIRAILLEHHQRDVAAMVSLFATLPELDRSPIEAVTIDQLALIWLALEAGGRRLRRAVPGTPWVANPAAVFGSSAAAMLTHRPSATR